MKAPTQSKRATIRRIAVVFIAGVLFGMLGHFAIFAVSGTRVRHLPIRPEEVREARART